MSDCPHVHRERAYSRFSVERREQLSYRTITFSACKQASLGEIADLLRRNAFS